MKQKNGAKGTCRNCGAAVVFHTSHGARPLESWQRNDHEHEPRPWKDRWWHRGTDQIPCVHPEGVDKKTNAVPREFCMERTWEGDLCNRRATNEEFHCCGQHAKPKIESKRSREAAERNAAERQLISEGLEDQMEQLRAYGIEVQRLYNGLVAFDPAQLLDFLEKYDEEF